MPGPSSPLSKNIKKARGPGNEVEYNWQKLNAVSCFCKKKVIYEKHLGGGNLTPFSLNRALSMFVFKLYDEISEEGNEIFTMTTWYVTCL